MKLLLLLAVCFAHLPQLTQDDALETGLYLSLNIGQGAYLQFSDGKTYEIDPDDRIYSSFWITPFPAKIEESDDPDYPVAITNLYTGTMVKGKEVSTKDLLKKEKEKTESLPPLSIEPKKETAPKEPKTPKTPQQPQKAPPS